jgi:Tol biopolymer transport system component
MTKDLEKQWQEETSKLDITSFEKVNKRTTSAYTDYLYPQVLDDGSILVMKRGIGDIEQFVRLTSEGEQKVFTPGFINDAGMLSASRQKIVWSEYGYDPRWRVKNFSLVKIFDMNSGIKQILGSKHDRLSGAALSPDGKTVVAIRSDNNYQNIIVLLDVETGRSIKDFSTPQNFFYSMPRWARDGKTIVMLKTSSAGRTVSTLDVTSGTFKDLLEPGNENIGHPVLVGNHLFFNSPQSGIDNIYALDLQKGKRYQVTSSKYGAYNPAVSPDAKVFIIMNKPEKDWML